MSKKVYPVVCRFEGMTPRDLGGYEGHRTRKYGDIGHVDTTRSSLNRLLIGKPDWAREAMDEIRTMAMENYAAELATLEKRGDRERLALRLAEGPKDPWRASAHGPLREVILLANKEWFEQTDDPNEMYSDKNQRAFEALAVDWLTKNFGDDVIHARADLDEQAYHIHAVIMPRATVRQYGIECRMLQPSIHPLIKNYEKAQDSVGEWFSAIGLTRGERRKQAYRDAVNDGRTPPPKRRHVRPAQWRQDEERRLAEKAAVVERKRREVEAREREAEDALAFADAVAAGEIDEHGCEIVPEPAAAPATAPSSLTPQRKSSPGFARARKAFRTAFGRLRSRALDEAAQAVASEMEEVKAADDVIVQIAQMLPPALRARIAQTRRKLIASILMHDRAKDPRSPGKARGQDSAEQGDPL